MNQIKSILLCSIVGMCASVFGAYYPSSFDFDSENLWGLKPEYGLDDSGGTSGETHWYFSGDTSMNECRMRAYGTSETKAPRPKDYPGESTPLGLLSVSTSDGTLFRSFASLTASTGPAPAEGPVVPKDGLYIDTAVSLSLCADLPDAETVRANGDKLLVSLYSDSEDLSVPGQLVITAARILGDGQLEAVNYLTTATFLPDTWHRLTVRFVPNAATQQGAKYSALVVYVDGTLVTCAEDEYAEKIGTGGAQVFAANGRYLQRALFPSLQTTKTTMRLYSLGVSGEMFLDRVTLAADDPFQQETEDLTAVIVCEDESLETLAYTRTLDDVSTEVVLSKPFSGTKITQIKPGEKIVFSPTASARGALTGGLICSGNSAAIESTSGYTVQFINDVAFASSEEVMISLPTKLARFSVNGQNFETFREAVHYANTNETSNVIALLGDVQLASAAAEDNGQARILPEQDVTFDLCGKKIKGEHFNQEAAIYAQGRLSIVDSVGGGAIDAAGEAIAVVADNDALDVNHQYASVALGSANVTNLFAVHGRVRVSNTNAVLTILVGDYLTPSDEDSSRFYLTNYLSARSFATPHVVAGEGTYWRALFNGQYRVTFSAPHAVVPPEALWVEKGAKISLPKLETPGYTITRWVDALTGETWDEATSTVERDVTLVSDETLLGPYSVVYDREVAGNPSAYTVESTYTELASPVSNLFTFTGWKDATSGRFVDAVGADATFVGTNLVVHGDLDLRAQWIPVQLAWSNTVAGLAESNGTYRGSWKLELPVEETCASFKVREIDFCLVNPLLYPKTAPRLAVKTGENAPIFSQTRTNYFDEASGRYAVGTNVLANGRAKIAYVFDNLVLTGGVSNELYFVDAEGNRTTGFLRLGLGTGVEIGNCNESGGDPLSAEYLKYCPLYEIRGEAAQ